MSLLLITSSLLVAFYKIKQVISKLLFFYLNFLICFSTYAEGCTNKRKKGEKNKKNKLKQSFLKLDLKITSSGIKKVKT